MDNLIASHPTSPHLVGAGFHARPALVDGQRWYAAPTLHQPLSHGAKRRDSSPFRGAEGWVEICGVYASVYHDADTHVQHSPVRGGVLDAPRSRDRRGGVVAPVRRDRWHPRHLRCVRLRPPPNASNPAGTARAPFHTGVRGGPSTDAGRAWKPAPTIDWESFSAQPAPSVLRRRGVEDAAPYGLCDRVCFSGAVRYGFPHPLLFMLQVRFRSRP